ncbi:sensor histidine kinase [Bacillus sp. BRMEA1]|uniref:sensor histidine kinase n=1 Tax=Neobacillus endophyticus TaxID=2738405 RepID=UPI0015652306|nr:ATP-binding protein [Neobacillus endophyticus]NRD78044.1 sensor histidine kinase [Neobacillus endophyticus]
MDPLQTKQQISSYIIDSQEEDIKRIALELHEGVGQNLYSILTGLQFVNSAIKEPQIKGYLQEMTLLIEKTIRETRTLSVELHPPVLTTLGLIPALRSYLKLYTSTFGILVDLDSAGMEKIIPERNSIAVFRVCQEALVNAAKYADTSNVKMTVHWTEDELMIRIQDFGKGLNLKELRFPKPTSGLAAMKERMLLIGGQCMISSKIGEGTLIEISLPL